MRSHFIELVYTVDADISTNYSKQPHQVLFKVLFCHCRPVWIIVSYKTVL